MLYLARYFGSLSTMSNHESKTAILAHSKPVNARKIRMRWLIAATSIPFLGVLTAFAIAPGTSTEHLQIKTVIENIALPESLESTDTLPAATSYWREESVERGDTAADLLQRLGVSDSQTNLFLKSADATRQLMQIRPGKTVQAEITGDGQLHWLRHVNPDGTMLQILPANGGFTATTSTLALDRQTIMKSGEIVGSLYAATDAAGIPDAVASQIADIFSSDIDFRHDLRRGDRFSLVYEVFYHDGQPVMTGRIQAVEFNNAGHLYRAVLSDVNNGKGEYFTPDGKPLKKSFLRSPVPFTRITSGFTMRFHPILKTWKQHKGIDFAAPIGTKVMAVADATVEYVGWGRGYGNMIILKHAGNISTVYGHLSAFAKGLHRGERVAQGDIIGYSGMTGWATGPHLHYEFRIANVPTNPLTAKIPTAIPIASSLMSKFHQETQPMLAKLKLFDGTQQVAME